MSNITYFPRYSQRENMVTNNTLLLILRLREFSRVRFERFMDSLCEELDHETPISTSWLRFQQQIGTGSSVVDGYIEQASVKIAVETKLTDKFDVDQLYRHLKMFDSQQQKILMLLSPSTSRAWDEQLKEIKAKAEATDVHLLPTTFDQIIKKARNCLSPYDEEMLALVDDYEDFCSDEELLPKDDITVFVPPCGKSFDSNIAHRLYYCDASWSRRKTRYLGIYKDRSVRALGTISKVVVCNVDVGARKVASVQAEAPAPTLEEADRILAAAAEAQVLGWDLSTGTQFFLCDQLAATDFRKETPRGIQGHRYLDLEDLFGYGQVPAELHTLAQALRQLQWK